MALKDWSVTAYFPEVRPAHLADQRVTVRASSLGTAARAGIDVIRERQELRGKKITTARITVRMIESSKAGEK